MCGEAGLTPIEVHNPYRPFVRRVVGALQEPISRHRKVTMWGTWAHWGFETILILSKARP